MLFFLCRQSRKWFSEWEGNYTGKRSFLLFSSGASSPVANYLHWVVGRPRGAEQAPGRLSLRACGAQRNRARGRSQVDSRHGWGSLALQQAFLPSTSILFQGWPAPCSSLTREWSSTYFESPEVDFRGLDAWHLYGLSHLGSTYIPFSICAPLFSV